MRWPWCIQDLCYAERRLERSQAIGKHHGTVKLRDKADSDQRGQANYGMTGCLSFSSLYDFLAGDEMEDRSLVG